jgi:hypothetical protein
MTEPPTIDPEFSRIFLPPTAHEYAQLEANLIADGRALCPLIVWEETNILLDGHYRLTMCEKYNLPYKIEYLSFASKGAAKTWLFLFQLGRRNASPASLERVRSKLHLESVGL